MSLLSRRSIKSRKLSRLPSKTNDNTEGEVQSCPNSPAVKKVYRLVVAGSSRTGKSAILNRFLEKEFEERYIPTIENFHRKLYKIKGEAYQLDIVDCSGNDPFPAARKLSYISGDMFVLVSSVDLAASVHEMLDVREQISACRTHRGVNSEPPMVMVLNKTDLPESRWEVDLAEVENQVHESLGENAFVSTSAAQNSNIDKIFGRVFTAAKCPKHMNPELHKMLRNELSADGDHPRRHLLTRMRTKFSKEGADDLAIYTDVNARRPSLRTDLLINRAKTSVITHSPLSRPIGAGGGDDHKCTIQ